MKITVDTHKWSGFDFEHDRVPFTSGTLHFFILTLGFVSFGLDFSVRLRLQKKVKEELRSNLFQCMSAKIPQKENTFFIPLNDDGLVDLPKPKSNNKTKSRKKSK